MIKYGINKHKDFALLKQSEIEYKKDKDLRKNALIIILYIFGFFFYLLSLREIQGSGMECFSRNGLNCFYILGLFIFFSALITNISLYLIVFKKHSKIHLFNVFVIYAFLFYFDHNTGLVKHGTYNIIVFFIIFVAIFFLLVFIHYSFFLYKKKRCFLNY